MLLLGVIAFLSYRSTIALLDTVDESARASEAITGVEQAISSLSAARGTARGYFISGDSMLLPRYQASVQDAIAHLNDVEATDELYPGYTADLNELRALIAQRIALIETRRRAYETGGTAAVARTMTGDEDDKLIEQKTRHIQQSVRHQLIATELTASRFARLTLSVILLGGVLALIFLLIASWIINNEIRKKDEANAQIAEREERLNDIVESASELIQLTTPDGRITGINRAWLETLGYKYERAKELDIMDVVHTDDRERWKEAVASALDGRPVRELPVDFVARDGHRVNLIGSLSCRFNEDRPESIRAIFRDVTEEQRTAAELREQEHRHEQFLESIPIGVYVLDEQGQPVYANSASLEILGRGIAPGTGPEDIAETYSAYLAGTNTIYPLDKLPILRALKGEAAHIDDMEVERDGRRVPLDVTAAPIYSSAGKVTGAVAAFTDITARREVERLKDELISVVSHELRTPLTSIRGALGLVGSGRLGELNERGRKMIEIAVTDTDRLVRLINDMLDIERMQSGRIEMHKTSNDAADLVHRAVQTLQSLANKADVNIEADAVSAPVFCDTDRILQTLTNLLGNAIKFSPAGSSVRVTAQQYDGEVEFRVIDRGRGIPRDKIEKIFERFQQVDATDAREKGGAGLGLAISRSIVVQHGGRIWADSDGTNGSTFAFTLPRITRQDSGDSVGDGAASLVLVVEDDSSAAEVLKAMLESEGYRVALAGNGRQAVELAIEVKPSAILLDLIMPEMNGWEAMAALKQHSETRDIPIVVVSGLASEIPHDERVAAWVDKPFEEPELRAALQRAFGKAAPCVLIVEDDVNLTEVLRTQFHSSGMRTLHARTGAEAIKIAQEEAPDLLVLDLLLPEKDGFDVVEWLKQHEKLRHLPLVVYTAMELADIQKKRLALGPSVFMTKSREAPGDVARRVAQLLNHVSRRPGREGA